jgi:gamma-glutamylcyclotransferase (GGCT)/AIG2-like uncharacterized protein YtfP
MPDLPYLFTYGTLKKGFANPVAQKLHAQSTFIGSGFFHGYLYQIEWYPGAIFDPECDSKVYGEIFQLNSPAIWKELDEYEDVLDDEKASLYLRKKVPVTMQNQEIISSWTYIFNQPIDSFTLIETGIFVS